MKNAYDDKVFITDNNLSFETRGFMMYLRFRIREFASKSDIHYDQQELVDKAVHKIYSELDTEHKELMNKVTAELKENGYKIGV